MIAEYRMARYDYLMKNDTQDVIFENNNEYNYRKNLISQKHLIVLKPREKEIIKLRRLSDKPKKAERN